MVRIFFLVLILTFQSVKSFADAELYVDTEVGIELKIISSRDNIFYDTTLISAQSKTKINFDKYILIELSVNKKIHLLFLENADDLKISFDNNEPIFEGIGAANNTFLSKFVKQFPEHFSTEINADGKHLDEVEIEAFDYIGKQKQYIKTYPKYDLLSKEFQKFILSDIKARYYLSLYKYAIERKKIDNFPQDFKTELDLKTPTVAFTSSIFKEWAFYYSAFKAVEQNDVGFPANSTAMYIIHDYWISENSTQSFDFKSFLLYKYADKLESPVLKSNITQLDVKKNATHQRLFVYLAAIPIKTETTDKDKPEQPALTNDLVLTDATGKTVKLSDFSKKVLYVDVWASWCGPCRAMAPHAKTLKASFSAKELKQIEFLYISIDESKEKWLKAVQDLQLEGVQLRSEGGWNSDACKYFGVSSIPRYVLIGKDGKILDSNAPRPNDPKIKELLLKAIE